MKLHLKSNYPFLSKVIDGWWIFSFSIKREESMWFEGSNCATVKEEDHSASLKKLQIV